MNFFSVFGTVPTPTVDYSAAFTSIVTEALNGITAVLPVAVPILGVMAAVGLGLKLFRKLTGNA